MLRAALGGAALVAISLSIAWLVLQWAILPRIDQWRPELEARATQALGVPVRIGAVEVTDAGSAWGPWHWARAIELRDVRLLRPVEAGADAAEPAAGLRLPSVRATLSPASLLPGWDGRWRLRFDQLLIEGAQLDVRRERDGRILVAGLEPRPGASDDGAAADWFFSQHEFAIRGGSLVWTDLQRGLAPLSLDAVDLVVRNGVRRHALRLDATPPAAWGGRFSLRGEFTQPLFGEWAGVGEQPAPAAAADAEPAVAPSLPRAPTLLARPGDWPRWRGQLYAEFGEVDVEPLREHLRAPIDLLRGRGALRAWIDVRAATPTAATLDLALRDVAVQLIAGDEPLAFKRIDGRLGARIEGRTVEQALTPASAAASAATIEPERGVAARLLHGPLRAEFRAQGFGFETADGLLWPAADVDLDVRFDADGRLDGGMLKAPRLDLGLLARLFERVPAGWVGTAAHEAVAALAPEGVATAVDARWQGPVTEPSSYAVKARLRGLAVAAASVPVRADESHPTPGRPGMKNLDLDLDATEAGGTALVALRAGELEFPGVFEAARVPFDTLDARLDWRRSPGRDGAPASVDLRAREVRFANADAQGELDARWQRSADTSPLGVLDLRGRLVHAEATAVPRYLPLRLPADLRHYLERAIQGGSARAVDVRVRGDLREFPFASAAARKPLDLLPAANEFRVSVPLEGVRFAYQPGDVAWDPNDPHGHRPWPAFTDIKGELIFDRQSMELRKLQGKLGTVGSGTFEMSGVRGGIRDLAHQATLTIDGAGRGPLADALAYIHATPVERWLGGALAQAQVPLSPAAATAPPLELKLALELPLKQIAQSTVRGSVVLAGNDLKLRPEVPLLGNARARIGFTERGFDLNGAARLLGGEATVEGGSQADGAVRLTVNGTASAEGLRRHVEGDASTARAMAALSGQAAYRLALGFPRGQPEWQLNSNLVGLGIDLPAPLRKSAEAAWPLQARLGAAADAQPVATTAGTSRDAARELLRIDLGPESARIAQAAWLRESGAPGARVLRGAVAVGEELPTMIEGVAARVALDRLDLDAWHTLADAPGAAAPAGPAASAWAAAGGYLPSTITLRAPLLVAGGREWHRAQASITRGSGADEGLWRAQLEATEIEGAIEYRAPGARGAGQDGRLQAHLARLVLPRQGSDAVGRLLDTASPTRVPALDITVDDLDLNGKRLGRVEIEAVNRAADAATGELASWQLDKFRMSLPGAQLSATGRWAAGKAAAAGSARRAQMDFRLDVSDGGALLARLGQPDVVKGAKGQLSGKLQWSGSPLAIDYPSLAGQVRTEFEAGQFLRAEPGVARLLGVLSLQSLPRRLLFDFRDVFEQGFAFDSVQGDIEIAEGVAKSRNLRMKGVQATVLMEGRADLGRETQDLHVWVVPEINAGTASLAVAAINPALGIGSFLAQLFLRRPLIEAGTREFNVTGPWTAPKVERIARTGAAPESDEAASAPTPPAPAARNPQEPR